MQQVFLGFDIGGSGIKCAPVDVTSGELVAERIRIETPQPSTPRAMADAVRSLEDEFETIGPVGIGFPSVVQQNGRVDTAMNIDASWVGVNGKDLFAEALQRDVVMLNDADAAGLAEFEFGAAVGVVGTVIVLTFGTGIGSALAVDGVIAPNVELGVLELDGHRPAERHFSAKARRREGLEWDEWTSRANRYLSHIHRTLAPDLIVVGGGISKHWDKYSGYFDDHLPLVPATLGNNAGLIGAALAASRLQTP